MCLIISNVARQTKEEVLLSEATQTLAWSQPQTMRLGVT
jgi:hypothetical protein